MRHRLTFFACLLALTTLGQGLHVSWNRFHPSVPCDGGPEPYILKQNFEGTGYDHCENWTNSTGIGLNPDYTATVLEGSQSHHSTNSTAMLYSPVFSNSTELWCYCLLKPMNIGAGATFIAFRNEDDNNRGSLIILNTGKLTLSGIGGSATSIGALTNGGIFHIWFHWKMGSGSDGVLDAGFSTDGIRPTSGDNYVEKTGLGSPPAPLPARIVRFWDTGPLTQEFIMDKVRVDDAQIGDNPP